MHNNEHSDGLALLIISKFMLSKLQAYAQLPFQLIVGEAKRNNYFILKLNLKYFSRFFEFTIALVISVSPKSVLKQKLRRNHQNLKYNTSAVF